MQYILNKINRISLNTLLVAIIFIASVSCKNIAQEGQIAHQILESKLPFKFELWFKNYQQKDSSLVYFYVPREFTLKNQFQNKISVQQSYWSDKGGNTVKGLNLFYRNEKLKSIKYPFKLESGETRKFKIYTRFEKVISFKDLELLEEIFDSHFEEKKKYQIPFNQYIRSLLNKQLPQKGYTRFRFYNNKTDKDFFHNVPFDY